MVTATLSQPRKLAETLLPLVTRKASGALSVAAKAIPSFIQDNFIDQGTRGKGGQNRWARLTRHSITWRRTYPHGGSPEEKDRYWRAHEPLRDTGALFNSFKPGRVLENADTLAVQVTSTTDYGWRHEYGEGTTPDGQPIWHRPHMYLWSEHDIPILRDAFVGAMA